jgi:hypothetical protein
MSINVFRLQTAIVLFALVLMLTSAGARGQVVTQWPEFMAQLMPALSQSTVVAQFPSDMSIEPASSKIPAQRALEWRLVRMGRPRPYHRYQTCRAANKGRLA